MLEKITFPLDPGHFRTITRNIQTNYVNYEAKNQHQSNKASSLITWNDYKRLRNCQSSFHKRFISENVAFVFAPLFKQICVLLKAKNTWWHIESLFHTSFDKLKIFYIFKSSKITWDDTRSIFRWKEWFCIHTLPYSSYSISISFLLFACLFSCLQLFFNCDE